MKKYVFLFSLFLLSSLPALGQEVCSIPDPQSHTISWVPPTEYENGTPLGTDLDGFIIYYGKTATGQYELPPIDVTASTDTSRVLDCLEPHTNYWLVMTAYVPCSLQPEAQECQSGQVRLESRTSSELSFVTAGPANRPNPPTGLVVSEANLTVYSVEESRNFIALPEVGTVPAGTPCNGSITVNGRYAVPIEAVAWAASVRAEVVVADCVPSL